MYHRPSLILYAVLAPLYEDVTRMYDVVIYLYTDFVQKLYPTNVLSHRKSVSLYLL